MCGIHGFADPRLSDEQSGELMQKMLHSTAHRGPDAAQLFRHHECTLGHNRLSILDLSPEGNQPMHFNQFTIVFNGEIYNYAELRTSLIKEGRQFKTHTDTEVILQAFDAWGEECVQSFIGMWAFAILNREDGSLFCSRDRFGIKPFYYIQEGAAFYFSSEIKSLRLSPCYRNTLNLKQISRFLQLGWIHCHEETMLEDIRCLKPGHHLHYKNGQIQIKAYWEIHCDKKFLPSQQEEAIAQFKNTILDSLKIHLRSDVPLGATLSGGIDSSTIVSGILGTGLCPQLSTFSIYYEGKDGVDERPFVQAVKEKFGDKMQDHYFSPPEKAVDEAFYRIQHMADFPLGGSSPISQYFIMQCIAQTGTKVILSGQGADDYLGGYMHTYYRLYADYIRGFNWLSAVREFNIQRQFQSYSFAKSFDVFLKSMLSLGLNESQLYQLEYSNYFPFAIPAARKNKIHLQDNAYTRMDAFHAQLMTCTSLPSLLHYEDRNSMAFSIESRVPFLDHRLVELGFQFPNSFKIKEGYTKWILREAMKEYLPEKIRFRRDKKGFVTPGEIKWLRGDLKHLLTLAPKTSEILDKSMITEVISRFLNGENKNANFVWRLATLNYWIKNIL